MRQASLHTPVGEITLFATAQAVSALEWGRGGGASLEDADHVLLLEAKRQLHAFFDGELGSFDLPIMPDGTAFQKRVWAHLCTIPLGETQSYATVARAVGSAPRAVGQAVARNPLPILIPCHRVTASAGLIGGYSGGEGPSTKLWLLSHETRMRGGSSRPSDEETVA